MRFSTAAGLELEGLLRPGGATGAVVCHPHPLHGGDMHNPVVATAADACADAGRSVLRFNFRGAGASQGTHGGGRDEVEDVLAAVSFMLEQGVEEVSLIGYSFGAFVIAHLPEGEQVADRVMIAPPVGVMDFSVVGAIPGLRLVVIGDRDPLAPQKVVAEALAGWSPEAQLEVVPGADHFFSGQLDRLRKVLLG